MFWEGINVNIKATNMDLSDSLTDYVVTKVTNLGRLLKKLQEAGGEVSFNFEVAKTTNHHKAGQVYKADCSIMIDGEQFYSSSEKEDIYEAVDDCKDQVFRKIKKGKEKNRSSFMKGAHRLKEMMKSAKFWN